MFYQFCYLSPSIHKILSMKNKVNKYKEIQAYKLINTNITKSNFFVIYNKITCKEQLKNSKKYMPTATFTYKTNYIFILLVLFLLIGLGCGQRGGGRSSGGGGRSSGGFSSGYYGGYGGSYYGRRTISCEERCLGNPICIQNCYAQGRTAGIIVGSVFGSCCLCGLLSFICCHKRDSALCKCCPCHPYAQIKRNLTQIDKQAMSQQQYRSKRDNIVRLLNQSQQANTFSYQQFNQYTRIQCSAEIVKQSHYLTQLKINGFDKEGNWTGEGYILPRNGQIFFWMYKEYNDKSYAGQTDQYQHLLYQSNRYDENLGMEGKWYFYKHQSDPNFSGKWKLHPIPQNPYRSPPLPNVNINPYGNTSNLYNQNPNYFAAAAGEQITYKVGAQVNQDRESTYKPGYLNLSPGDKTKNRISTGNK